MLWLKAFHIVFVVTWFAGLFYLPRLFVYHAAATDALSIERFKTMERRLFAMMTIGATLALLFGIAMLIVAPGLLQAGWLHAKLTLVVGADRLSRLVLSADARFRATAATGTRDAGIAWFNEVPTPAADRDRDPGGRQAVLTRSSAAR